MGPNIAAGRRRFAREGGKLEWAWRWRGIIITVSGGSRFERRAWR